MSDYKSQYEGYDSNETTGSYYTGAADYGFGVSPYDLSGPTGPSSTWSSDSVDAWLTGNSYQNVPISVNPKLLLEQLDVIINYGIDPSIELNDLPYNKKALHDDTVAMVKDLSKLIKCEEAKLAIKGQKFQYNKEMKDMIRKINLHMSHFKYPKNQISI